jgi:regulatory protein
MTTGRKSLAEILLKMRNFCGYQERCHSEVRSKLLKMRVYGDDLEAVVADLVKDDFLNEERYARSFARGKFRINHWGRNKIRLHLKRRGLSDYCIRKGLEEIDPEEYQAFMRGFVEKKLYDQRDYKTRRKVGDALIRKGYEPQLVWESINTFAGDN